VLVSWMRCHYPPTRAADPDRHNWGHRMVECGKPGYGSVWYSPRHNPKFSTTQTPRPGIVRTSPSSRSTSNARFTVPTAIPCSCESVFAEGSGDLGGYLPEAILSRSRSASCRYTGTPDIGSIITPG
jgi:hypothetical protein